MRSEKIKVLVVDDSAIYRQFLTKILGSDPSIQVIGTAADPYIAADKMALEVPDVITLDIEMPRMDGITFLRKIMSQHPIPVVIISSVGKGSVEISLKALEYGASEVLAKDDLTKSGSQGNFRTRVCEAVKNAANSKVGRKTVSASLPTPKLSADVIIPYVKSKIPYPITEKVIAIGASTGGTEAIRVVLEALPLDAPGVIIVQHMPENFTKSFAQRLNDLCRISVKEAEDGDVVKPGHALIAPGNRHLLLKKRGLHYFVEVKEGPPVNRHRPSVDVLFRSAAICAGKNAVGVLLTGMGDDGARGLLEMKESGAKTIAQDEKSCVVFGMPREAIALNAADKVLPLPEIAKHLLQLDRYQGRPQVGAGYPAGNSI